MLATCPVQWNISWGNPSTTNVAAEEERMMTPEESSKNHEHHESTTNVTAQKKNRVFGNASSLFPISIARDLKQARKQLDFVLYAVRKEAQKAGHDLDLTPALSELEENTGFLLPPDVMHADVAEDRRQGPCCNLPLARRFLPHCRKEVD
jgi:hypothetical protein